MSASQSSVLSGFGPRPRSPRGGGLGLVARGIVILAAAGVPAAAAAADLRPAWECLPDNTFAVARLPQPAAFVETLLAKTKFGAVMLSPARLEGARKLIATMADELPMGGPPMPSGAFDMAEFEARLGTYDLKMADFEALFRNEIGVAVAVQPRPDGQQPLVTTLVWVEPGADAAGRMLAAARRAFEDQARDQPEGPARPRRIDLELAGHEVMWVITPTESVNLEGEFAGLEFDDEDGDEPLDTKLQEKLQNAPRRVVGHGHAAITRIGPRLVFFGLQTQARAAAGQPPENATAEDAERAMDEARGVLQRFLAAHGEDAKPALADAMRSAAFRASLPPGQQLLDVVLDPRILIRTLATSDDEVRVAVKRLAGIGLAELGPCAWRHAFDEGRYQSALVVSLPAPRTGLMRILDQQPDAAEPPPFVTGDTVDFTQVSLDLGKTYEMVRDYATAEFGEQAANLFAVGEANAQAMLGADVSRILSSFGSRHWTVNYPAKISEAVAAGRQAGGALAALNQANRGALVWKVADEPLVLKLLQRGAPLAGGELQEEQGFRGLRIPNGPAVFVGRDHLVVGIGAESLEKTLASIRNPPADAASLREGNAVRRARELQPLDPALVVTISDATKGGGILGNLRQVVAAMRPEDVDEEQREVLLQSQQLLPTAEEMEGMFGVGVDTIRMTEHGLVFRSVWELPAP